jgi:hypothetical protein
VIRESEGLFCYVKDRLQLLDRKRSCATGILLRARSNLQHIYILDMGYEDRPHPKRVDSQYHADDSKGTDVDATRGMYSVPVD